MSDLLIETETKTTGKQPALVPDDANEPLTDYIFQGESCWIQVSDGIQLYLLKNNIGGLDITVCPVGDAGTTLDYCSINEDGEIEL